MDYSALIAAQGRIAKHLTFDLAAVERATLRRDQRMARFLACGQRIAALLARPGVKARAIIPMALKAGHR